MNMSLSSEIVDRVFAKLALTYGHRFLSIWDGMPIEAVKADWGQELSSVRPDRILWALQNLPERAPDAPTFRALCSRMPEPNRPMALPRGPKRAAPALARMLSHRLHREERDGIPQRVRWARDFIATWGRPEARPTFAQREALLTARRIVELYEAKAATEE
jgi:hypothetical protein